MEEDIKTVMMMKMKKMNKFDYKKARENADGVVELVYGHHRLEAAKRVYGKNRTNLT
jgi:hypothetical protein